MIKQPLLSEQPKIRCGDVRALDHGRDILEIATFVNRVFCAKGRVIAMAHRRRFSLLPHGEKVARRAE
jgi:hypothetical protein